MEPDACHDLIAVLCGAGVQVVLGQVFRLNEKAQVHKGVLVRIGSEDLLVGGKHVQVPNAKQGCQHHDGVPVGHAGGVIEQGVVGGHIHVLAGHIHAGFLQHLGKHRFVPLIVGVDEHRVHHNVPPAEVECQGQNHQSHRAKHHANGQFIVVPDKFPFPGAAQGL